MKPFALTKKAKADLLEIAIYTEQRWGVAQRNIYTKQFDEAFHLLAKHPAAGKECDYIKVGYRKFPQGSHLIFYRDGTDCMIEVVRILHKNMDVETELSGG
ncbi:MAG: type II toxin-antitoxin system RelE/ParE family toxin [Pseudomonadota bacterium]